MSTSIYGYFDNKPTEPYHIYSPSSGDPYIVKYARVRLENNKQVRDPDNNERIYSIEPVPIQQCPKRAPFSTLSIHHPTTDLVAYVFSLLKINNEDIQTSTIGYNQPHNFQNNLRDWEQNKRLILLQPHLVYTKKYPEAHNIRFSCQMHQKWFYHLMYKIPLTKLKELKNLSSKICCEESKKRIFGLISKKDCLDIPIKNYQVIMREALSLSSPKKDLCPRLVKQLKKDLFPLKEFEERFIQTFNGKLRPRVMKKLKKEFIIELEQEVMNLKAHDFYPLKLLKEEFINAFSQRVVKNIHQKLFKKLEWELTPNVKKNMTQKEWDREALADRILGIGKVEETEKDIQQCTSKEFINTFKTELQNQLSQLEINSIKKAQKANAFKMKAILNRYTIEMKVDGEKSNRSVFTLFTRIHFLDDKHYQGSINAVEKSAGLLTNTI